MSKQTKFAPKFEYAPIIAIRLMADKKENRLFANSREYSIIRE